MRFPYLLFLAVVLCLLPLFDATPFTLPESRALHTRGNEKAGSSKSAGKQVAPPGRNAYMFFQIKYGLRKSWGKDPDWPTHSFLWIDGDENNGAVKLEVNSMGSDKEQPVLRYVEYQKDQDVEAPKTQQTYGLQEPAGTTSVSNIDLMDQNAKGTPGILIDAIRHDPTYRTGPAYSNSLNSCHDVLERIINLTDGLKMSEKSRACIQTYNTWVIAQPGEKYNIWSQIKYISKYAADRTHHVEFKKKFTTVACPEKRLKRDLTCSLPIEESANGKGDVLEVAALNRLSNLPDDTLIIASTDDSKAKPTPPGIVKDSRRYSYLSGWHVKLMFHIG